MIRKIITTCLFSVICLYASAKITYVPKYYTQINIEGNSGVSADSAVCRELCKYAPDGRYSITVMHDSVTQERIKSIKRMLNASEWASVAAVFSGVAAFLAPLQNNFNSVTYYNEMNTMASSSMLSVAASGAAEELRRVNITIRIDNYSDKEMVVNDMKRGLTWFVPAKNYVSLDVGNPEVNKIRIAYAEGSDIQRDYITIQAGNILARKNVAIENDSEWIFGVTKNKQSPATGEIVPVIDHYRIVNKITFESKDITIDEFKALKKAAK